jgi:hypothetical protein
MGLWPQARTAHQLAMDFLTVLSVFGPLDAPHDKIQFFQGDIGSIRCIRHGLYNLSVISVFFNDTPVCRFPDLLR